MTSPPLPPPFGQVVQLFWSSKVFVLCEVFPKGCLAFSISRLFRIIHTISWLRQNRFCCFLFDLTTELGWHLNEYLSPSGSTLWIGDHPDVIRSEGKIFDLKHYHLHLSNIKTWISISNGQNSSTKNTGLPLVRLFEGFHPLFHESVKVMSLFVK